MHPKCSLSRWQHLFSSGLRVLRILHLPAELPEDERRTVGFPGGLAFNPGGLPEKRLYRQPGLSGTWLAPELDR